MAEHDFIIDNGTGSAVRTDLNNLSPGYCV